MNPLSQVEPLRPTANEPVFLPSVRCWIRTVLIGTWSALKWIMQRAQAKQKRKNLRVCETIPLGEKRFVAVVQVDDERFLIGGSSSSVSLLTRLPEKSFAANLAQVAEKIS